MFRPEDLVTALEAQGIHAEIQINKKNGVPMVGVVLGEGTIKPCVYPAQMEMELLDAVEQCIKLVNMDKTGIDPEMISDWNRAKELVKLAIRPVIDDDIVTVKLLDVELYFRIWTSDTSSAAVTEQLRAHWGIETNMILATAMANTADDYEFMTLMQKMNSIVGIECEAEENPEMLFAGSDCYGASILAFPNKLKNFLSKYEGDFIILPASAHEVIIVKEVGQDAESLKNMVREINETQVAPEDRLSNNVYRIDKKTGKISICE